MTKTKPLPAAIARKVAVQAEVDPRTVQRVVLGLPVRLPLIAERIRKVLAEMGLVALLMLVSCSSGDGMDRKAAQPDAGGAGGRVSATSPTDTTDAGMPPDALVLVDQRMADTVVLAPDTRAVLPPDASPLPDTFAPAPDAGLAPDTVPQTQPDALVLAPDTSPPDVYRAPDAYRAPDTIPPDTAPLKFMSCKYLGFLVSKMTAGQLCGHYPTPGPNGTIYCFTGCTVATLFDVPTVPPNVDADSNDDGYCGGPTDESQAMPGGNKLGSALCFGAADTCAKVCIAN